MGQMSLTWARNFQLYTRLIGVQIRSQMQYRAAFWLDLIGTALTMGTFFLGIAFVVDRFGSIGGWNVGEVAFLYGMVEMSFGLMDMIFDGFDPRNFGNRVRLGTFDQLLLRPVNITLQVLGSDFVLRRLGRVTSGVVVFFIALQWVEIEWTLGKILYLPWVVIGMIAFFGGLFIIGATITFWTIDSIEVINIFTYGTTEMIAYPMHIYPDWLRNFFTFLLPAALINYYPALFFLDRPDPFGLPPFMPFLAPFAGGAVLLVALGFWRFGIAHYQSTGT
jgi:ABC-2 type transport system permease protein